MARKTSKKEEQTATEAVAEETVETLTADAVSEEAEVAGEDADPLRELNQAVDAAQAKAAENWDLYLRERAELENFRKRAQRDKEDAIRFANDRLLKELIPVLDNLERAVEHAGQNCSDDQGLLEGVTMTISLFTKALLDFGVKPVVALGEVFDPNFHQAMGHVETDEQPANTVVSEFQKGYLLNDRLLRPSMVMVAKAPAAGNDQTDNQEDA